MSSKVSRMCRHRNDMNISTAVATASLILQNAEIPEPRREASALLAFVLRKEPVFLIAHPEYQLIADESSVFDTIIRRRAAREPFHYITGQKEFFGLAFKVSPAVLIPRPETEILVEEAIKLLRPVQNAEFYEIGVGSGCISISILSGVPDGSAVAVDISEAALDVAAQNAERHNVTERVELITADLFAGLNRKFDAIVTNPPYIPDNELEVLQAEVKTYEPHSALFGGSDGLDIIRRIVNEAPYFLHPNGFIMIEIGFGQAEKVRRMFSIAPWKDLRFLDDQQGIHRTVFARLSPVSGA